MTSRAAVEAVLAQRDLAFVGASRESTAFANAVYRAFVDAGHVMHPVHPVAGAIEGDPCVRSLAELRGVVGGVVVLLPPDAVLGVVRDAIAAGITSVWLHRAAASDEAVRLCRVHGVTVVDGACPLLFLEPVRGVHRLHRAIARHRFVA